MLEKMKRLFMDYVIKGEPVDGLAFLVGLQTHGKILNGSCINSNSWHGKELGVIGDFKTKYLFKPADTRSNHKLEPKLSFDFCSTTTTNPKGSDGSPAKKFKFATTYATPESPAKPRK